MMSLTLVAIPPRSSPIFFALVNHLSIFFLPASVDRNSDIRVRRSSMSLRNELPAERVPWKNTLPMISAMVVMML
jgi:hypothetical protein